MINNHNSQVKYIVLLLLLISYYLLPTPIGRGYTRCFPPRFVRRV